jgi:hypothetical protein
MENRNILYIALTTALILLVPLIAMQFTNEVKWTLFDFVFAGTLSLAPASSLKSPGKRQRAMAHTNSPPDCYSQQCSF